MFFDRNGFRFLNRECKPDRQDGLPRAQSGYRTIIVPLAIPDPVASAIEAGERHEEHIGVHCRSSIQWLADAETHQLERLAGSPRMEAEKRVVHAGKAQRDAPSIKGFEEWARIDFAADRPVGGYDPGLCQFG